MTVPAEVLKAAKGLIDIYGPNFEYLGEKNGEDIYMFQFPADLTVGFPFVYFYEKKSKKAFEVTGFEAVNIIASFGIE